MYRYDEEVLSKIHELSAKELSWCHRLEKLLMSVPSRFGIYTTGKKCLQIYDSKQCDSDEVEHDLCVPTNTGYGLAEIECSICISGTEG